MIRKKNAAAVTGYWVPCLLGILIVLSEATAGLAASDRRDDIEATYRARVDAVQDRYAKRLDSLGLFRRFRHIVEALGLPPEREPTNLFDLSNALGSRPDLIPEFMRILETPLTGASARRDTTIQRLAARLEARIDRIDQRLGPRPGITPETEYIEPILQALDPDSYLVSGPYELKPPGLLEPAAFEVDPISFDSAFMQDLMAEGTPFGAYCIDDPSCAWPLPYDLVPPQIYLYWRTTSFTFEELKDIVAQNGFAMSMTVNGQLILPGPQVPYGKLPSSPDQGYWAFAMKGDDANYIVTILLARDVLQLDDMPWQIELDVYDVEPLDIPKLIGIDENGNPIFAHDKLIPLSTPAVTFSPNPTNSQSYFEAMLYPTFQSDRCTDCHGFGTIANLAEHHKNDPNDFIKYTGAHLEPSAYVPGAHVIMCQSCHHLQTVDEHGNPFHEIEWKAPAEDLDLNWKLKTATQTCKRVVENLPTPELRHEHFHKDARLFWAIEEPYVPGKFLPPPAEPGDFDEFLRRVDIWNDAGAPCP